MRPIRTGLATLAGPAMRRTWVTPALLRMAWRIRTLCFVSFCRRCGTEIVVRDLALGLARRGHRVTVFSPLHGPLAREISAGGVPVVSSLREVRVPPDVVHGHHHAVTVEALLAFPSVPALFVCHDRLASTDVPPLHPRVLRWVSVDANTAGRLEAYGIPAERHTNVLNAVDLDRFKPRPPPPRRPARAPVLSIGAGSAFPV